MLELPFCGKCGAQVPSQAESCGNCKADLGADVYTVVAASHLRKNVGFAAYWLAGLVGIFIFGIGHFYLRKIKRGTVFLVAGIIVKTALFLPLPILLVIILNLGLWIGQIYDVHALARKYNAEVERTGNAPS